MAKVLIIDDEEPILKMYSTALTPRFEVITAENGQDGLDKARKEHPDLIYLDIIMPSLNGLDVLRQLKEDKSLSETPVILLTNLPEEASAEKAKSLGATDYFVKVQYEPDILAERTAEILGEPDR